jgi:hypothetical protein
VTPEEPAPRRRLLVPLLVLAGALFLGLLVCAGVAGYLAATRGRVDYPPLGTVDRIVVRDNLARDLAILDDPARVRSVVEFLDERRAGWGGLSDLAGVPVPYLRADLYRGREFLGSFGVGRGFFECQREGDFRSRSCTRGEAARFLGLVGLPDYDPDRPPDGR